MGNLRVACRYAEQIETAQTNRNADRPEIGYAPTVVQMAHYDPWGVKLPLFLSNGKDRYQGNPENRFKFTGKEAQPDLSWIDLGARMYDPTIGRENGVDQLSELDFETSTYSYAGNNPINFVDLFGLKKGDPDDPIPLNEVTVTAKRDEAYTGYFGNVFANSMAVSIDESRTGKRNEILQGYEDGTKVAAAIISAPIAAIGAAEIGAGALLQQGISYLSRARMMSVGRLLLRQNVGSALADFTIQKITSENGKINWTSVIANATISNPFLSAFAGSAFDSRTNETLFSGKDQHIIIYETLIGGLGNKLGDFGSNISPSSTLLGKYVANFMGNSVGNIGSFVGDVALDKASVNYTGQSIKKNIEFKK